MHLHHFSEINEGIQIVELDHLLFLRRSLSKTRAKNCIWTKVFISGYGPYGWIAPWSLITKIRFLDPTPKSGRSYANFKTHSP